MPKVSVIMGIYNCVDTLPIAVDSIINQTYTDWELIMCDDGSSDDTYKVAFEYTQKDNRIKLIKNEKNMRLAYSLNHCLEYAKGEYIARMDADDISLPERFEKQVAYLDAHPEMAVVSSAATIFDEKGDKLIRGLGNEYPLRKSLLLGSPFMHVTIMMRKAAYDLLGGYRVSPETMRTEDADLWFRFRLEKLDGYVIQEPLVKVRECANDLKRRSIKAAWWSVKLHKKYYKLLNIPVKWRLRAYKPLVSALIPRWIMAIYHRYK